MYIKVQETLKCTNSYLMVLTARENQKGAWSSLNRHGLQYSLFVVPASVPSDSKYAEASLSLDLTYVPVVQTPMSWDWEIFVLLMTDNGQIQNRAHCPFCMHMG